MKASATSIARTRNRIALTRTPGLRFTLKGSRAGPPVADGFRCSQIAIIDAKRFDLSKDRGRKLCRLLSIHIAEGRREAAPSIIAHGAPIVEHTIYNDADQLRTAIHDKRHMLPH